MTLPPWHAEIVELHDFFQGWLGRTLPATDGVYARLRDTQAPEFTIVTPGGALIPGDRLLAQLRAAHGSRPGIKKRKAQNAKRKKPGRDERKSVRFTLCALRSNVFRSGSSTLTGRSPAGSAPSSSAISPARPTAWVHVHETWLPEAVQRKGHP